MRVAIIVLLVACSSPTMHDVDGGAGSADAAEKPDPVALLGTLRGSCNGEGWCWIRPTPRGGRYTGIHHTSPDDLWLIGESGLVMQWNGATWREHALPPLPPEYHAPLHVFSITGLGPGDVWIAGGSFIYHWDGSTWTLEDTVPVGVDQRFGQIWEAPNRDVWVAMDYGIVKRSIGGGPFEALTIEAAQNTLSEIGGVWGTGPNDIWFSGRPSRKFHWDGQAFTEFPTPTPGLSGGKMWGTGSDDIWTGAGLDGFVIHWNGTQWSKVDTGLGNGWYLHAIAGVAKDDVWWIAQKSSVSAAFLHWDGNTITKTTFQSQVFLFDFDIVDGRWWMPGDNGAVFVKDGVAGPMTPVTPVVEESYSAIWGTGDRDLFVAGPSLLGHFDGETVTEATLPSGALIYRVADLDGIQIGMEDEVWAAGSRATTGAVYHFDGAAWTVGELDPTHPFNAIWAAGPGEALVVGDGGVVYRFAGGSWSPIASGVTSDLTAIWGPDANLAYIVGSSGTLLQWNRATPATLTVVQTGTTADFTGIAGAGSSVWIGSRSLGTDYNIAVFELTSTGLVRHPIPYYEGGPVFARGATDVVFGSGHGWLYRWNGSSFVEEYTGAPDQPIESVFQPPGGKTWIGGFRALLRHD